MSLSSELTSIKNVEDTLTNNKVAQFAYTQCAYECNCANGVTEYDVTNEQNIPVGTPLVMNVNETVLAKGWRSQASTITRMLMNHFLGRISYNLNKVNDNMSNLLTQLLAYLGQANGIATLDANGRIPYSQLPESAIEFKGMWNANTNTPTLHDGTGVKGDFYIVSVAGTQDLGSGSIQFFANDRVIYDGAVWNRLSAGDVKTVNNVQPVNGNITLTKSDLGLGNVDNTADANKSVCYATSAGSAGSATDSTCFGGCTYACAKADFRNYTPDLAVCACRDADGCLFGTASRYSCNCFAKAGATMDTAICAQLTCVFRLKRNESFSVALDRDPMHPDFLVFCMTECSEISVADSFGSIYIDTQTALGGHRDFCNFEYRVVCLEKNFAVDGGNLLYNGGRFQCACCACTLPYSCCSNLAPSSWISGHTGFYFNNPEFEGKGWIQTFCGNNECNNCFTYEHSRCLELQHPVGVFYRCDARSCYYPVVEVRVHY